MYYNRSFTRNKIFRKVIVIIIIKVNPQEPIADVELVGGYGIFSAKRCIDAVDSCPNNPTCLM